jgi:plastocyanin
MAGTGGAGKTWAAIAVAVVAIIIAGASLSLAYSATSSASQQSSSVQQQISSLESQMAVINATPGVVGIKMQWCTQNVLQDRFCPMTFTVVQGDIVQILFMQNDTASHTFTLDTAPYNFQINDSGAGELNFLQNYSPVAGACSNSGTYAQQSAGLSGVYCVSGTSLLSLSTLQDHAAANFRVAQNPSPGLPFTPNTGECVSGEPSGTCLSNPGVILFPMDNQATMLSLNVSGVGVNATGGSETQGDGAFWATTPGIYEFFCQYHVSNGMFGYMIVLPNSYCTTNAAACGIGSSGS